MMAGVLIVDKPQGPTSHDIVAVARRALGERRIGHCGTLDPLATGVLALAVGAATRLVQFLASDEKDYDAVVLFGRTTNSYDVTGEVETSTADRPTREAVEAALTRFRGSFDQSPPAYSAKRVAGARAYDLARSGRDGKPALSAAPVTVGHLALTDFDGDRAFLSMRVSSGFYVRSLAHDLGEVLGTGAVLERLRRTRSGDFGLEEAVTMDRLATAGREALGARLIPLARLLPRVPGVHLSSEEAVRARRGLDVAAPSDWATLPDLAKLYDQDGHLVGLAHPAAGRAGFLHPSVVLG